MFHSRFVIALLLTAPLIFGAMIHTAVPHQHSENQSVVDLMHTTLHAKDLEFVAMPVFVALFMYVVVFVSLSAPLRRRYALKAVSIEEGTGQSIYMRRGSARYRRFV